MRLKLPVYLDNHATTRVDPRVVDAMLPFFSDEYGNAASRQHEFGWRAEAAVEKARAQVAALIGASVREVVFTSGATESINLAIKGSAEALSSRGNHVITAATEHKAVLDTCATLGRYGFDVTVLPVDRFGLVDPDEVRSAITPKTILVTVMSANNEIGAIAPIVEIGAVCRENGVLFHTDATQAVAKIPWDVREFPVDLASFSAHKMYGPKGIGALYVRTKTPALTITTQIDGGGHERGLRSGTLNVPAIVGFGKAAEIALAERERDAFHTATLRDDLVRRVTEMLSDVASNGHPSRRLPHNASLTFGGVKADAVMMAMKDLAVSTGSACSTASPEPSHVLRALGMPDDEVLGTIRFGLGRFTTKEEIDYAVVRIVESVNTVRKRAGSYAAVM